MQMRSWMQLLPVAAALALLAAPVSANAAPDCAAEAAMLQAISSGVRIDFNAPKSPTVGGTLEIAWHAKARAPVKTPVFIAIAIDGEIRAEAAPRPEPPKATTDDLSPAPRSADLPGFLALSPAATGPLGLGFGTGQSRILIPLHHPGAKREGALQIRLYEAGQKTIAAAVVARTGCGERVLLSLLARTLTVEPGQPEIVVQDPFDLETPDHILVSNSGRYRVHIYDAGRYRVYDVATGSKLVDRAGHDPNFSPTSRFIVANTGARGSNDYELIDLVSRDVVTMLHGQFIGWAHGDSFLITGGGQYGALSVRPTLISRPVIQSEPHVATPESGPDVPGDEPYDGLELQHPGSCHACASWTDDNLMLDLDNGIVAFTGTFDQSASPVFELASGASQCCNGSAQDQQAFIDRTYAVVPFQMPSGWHARDAIRFSQIYDPLADPNAKEFSDQTWYQGAFSLRDQLLLHHAVDPQKQTIAMAAAASNTVVRGDWRARMVPTANPSSAAGVRSRLLTELARFDLVALAPASRETIPFVNSWAGSDRAQQFHGDEARDKRIDTTIEQRTRKLEDRLGREVPALNAHLGRKAVQSETYEPPLPLEGLAKGKIYLIDTLEGLWRWNLAGRPVWFLQLWATEGNGGFGEGAMFLIEGDKSGLASPKGRIVDLTQTLAAHWSGAYGASDHQTQLKPQMYLDRYLVSGSVAAKSIAVYDLERDSVLAILKNVPQADLMEDVILTRDMAHVIQINSDGQFFIHDLGSGRVALSGRVVDDETILYTSEGYYWSSYEGAHFVQLRFPGLPGLYPFQQFAAILDRPDIIKAQLMSGAALPPAPTLVPPPSLEVAVPVALGEAENVQLDVRARASAPLVHLRLYADGRLVGDTGLSGFEMERKISVAPSRNARWLTAQVSDARGLVSKPQAVRLSPRADRTNVLRAVSVGINAYNDPKLHLKFARSDAERLGAALTANSGQYYARTEATLLLDGQATKDAILAALKRSVAAATADDTLVFSFAGHGVQALNHRYYLAPADIDVRGVEGTGLAWADVAHVLQATKARVIVILDSCHAGLSGVEGLGTNDDAVGALLSETHAPMLVLAASKGRQFSYEGGRWGGGVFTSALIDAIQRDRPRYDLDQNGAIEASELYYALKSIVVRETAGQQTPWLVRQDLLGDFAIF